MESPEKFLVLLDKYTSNSINAEEHDELFLLIASGKYNYLLEDHFHAHIHDKHLPTVEIHPQRAQELMQRIISAEKQTADILPRAVRAKKIFRWSMAASIGGLIVLVLWFFSTGNRNNTGQAAVAAGGMLEKTNRLGRTLSLKLEDGSSILLKPGASLHYPTHFQPDKREVWLEGEAFFVVSKNPDRPFFVYHKNLVTHVLGTSFNVRADPSEKLVEVSVVTGRVQVYENRRLPDAANDKKNNGVILTPNQKVIYREEARQFTTSIVSTPLPVVPDKAGAAVKPENFVYEETSLREVIGALEKTYALEIVVENEKMYNCLFTGDVSHMDLFGKLDVICQSVKASYQVAGTKILVEGKGCN
ncbi:MAG TPA: FecR domain-containing protein [Chitinophagaceae bacterium]|nr:FecR domain-containing protein [Chitinophagaceae bacterium]